MNTLDLNDVLIGVRLGNGQALLKSLQGNSVFLNLKTTLLFQHLAPGDQAHVGFELHAFQVLGQRKKHRGLQRRGHSLAGFNRPLQDNAIDRRQDLRLVDVNLLQFQIGNGDLNVGLGRNNRGDRPLLGAVRFDRIGVSPRAPFAALAAGLLVETFQNLVEHILPHDGR